MNRQSLLAQIDKLLPLAAKWAAAVEKRILREGVPLSEQGLADARARLGVREAERVRLLALPAFPLRPISPSKLPPPRFSFSLRRPAASLCAMESSCGVIAGRAPTDCSRTGPHRAIRAARRHPALPPAISHRVFDRRLSRGTDGTGGDCRSQSPRLCQFGLTNNGKQFSQRASKKSVSTGRIVGRPLRLPSICRRRDRGRRSAPPQFGDQSEFLDALSEF